MSELPEMLAVIVVRDGTPPRGTDETVAEAEGAVLLAGTGTDEAATRLTTAERTWALEAPVAPGSLAAALAPLLEPVHVVLMPASPDGRDLAPRLAHAAGRDLHANATSCTPTEAEVTRLDDALSLRTTLPTPAVVTLTPDQRGTATTETRSPTTPTPLSPDPAHLKKPSRSGGEKGGDFAGGVRDAEVVRVVGGGSSGSGLEESERVLGGGAGLVGQAVDGVEVMRVLEEVAGSLGGRSGVTRVVTDAGWAEHERQIGTTGVVIDPRLYVAFGVSGASQHVGGIGRPEHVVSVNTDPSCPMTALADLGIVADAPAVLAELARRLLRGRDD